MFGYFQIQVTENLPASENEKDEDALDVSIVLVCFSPAQTTSIQSMQLLTSQLWGTCHKV